MFAPRLFFFDRCSVSPDDTDEYLEETKILEYLPQYRWKPQRTNFTEEDSPEKPRKKDDHNIDCLGHILVAMDDLPEVEESRHDTRSAEQRMADEHFEAELAAATERAPLRRYRPGHIPSAV